MSCRRELCSSKPLRPPSLKVEVTESRLNAGMDSRFGVPAFARTVISISSTTSSRLFGSRTCVLPESKVKIDRSFVKYLAFPSRHCRSWNGDQLARAFGVDVVEGSSNDEQRLCSWTS